MDLAALIAPVTVDDFTRDFFGQAPLHVPATPGRRKAPLDWPRLTELLAIAPHWTPGNISLILNRRPVAPEFYFDEVLTLAGPVQLADPAKVEMFLTMGASLVGNDVDAIAPELRDITLALGGHFAALANANVYASFKGVQGFATHYDLHDVFAVQCAGEKIWHLYANRAVNPVAPLATGGDAAQAQIDAARGPLVATVRMRPGDVLYLPRGIYHDALATDAASLHVTVSLAPHSGEAVLHLLQAAALRDPAMRAWLPDGRGDPAALAAHLRGWRRGWRRLWRAPAFATKSSMHSGPGRGIATPCGCPPHRAAARPTRHGELCAQREGGNGRTRGRRCRAGDRCRAHTAGVGLCGGRICAVTAGVFRRRTGSAFSACAAGRAGSADCDVGSGRAGDALCAAVGVGAIAVWSTKLNSLSAAVGRREVSTGRELVSPNGKRAQVLDGKAAGSHSPQFRPLSGVLPIPKTGHQFIIRRRRFSDWLWDVSAISELSAIPVYEFTTRRRTCLFRQLPPGVNSGICNHNVFWGVCHACFQTDSGRRCACGGNAGGGQCLCR